MVWHGKFFYLFFLKKYFHLDSAIMTTTRLPTATVRSHTADITDFIDCGASE